jgi:hypothetical protein
MSHELAVILYDADDCEIVDGWGPFESSSDAEGALAVLEITEGVITRGCQSFQILELSQLDASEVKHLRRVERVESLLFNPWCIPDMIFEEMHSCLKSWDALREENI